MKRVLKLQCYSIYLTLLVLLTSSRLVAQYSPYFENYSLSEYNAGNQNWDVSRADNGKVYVANNKGLLEYDGLKWNFYELPNKTTLRSVMAIDNRVYTGSYEEFGFWKSDDKGDLIYESLSDKIKDSISKNEEIWQIVPYKNLIVFRSFLNIYIYDKDKDTIKKKKPQSVVISCSVADGKFYISTLKGGTYILENEELIPVINEAVLIDAKIISITPYDGKLLITTSLRGCFVYDQTGLKPVNFEINDIIKQHQLNSFSMLEDGRMVFGTIKDGVYLTNREGDVIFHVNKENGLVNNTVLSQYLDVDNTLWIGLDNGLASVDLSSHNYFFNDVSGKLGAVYDVINFEDTIYIGSNTGLFYLDDKNKLQFIKGTQGQVWDLKEVNGELFCGHNDGTFLVKNKNVELISVNTGGYVIKKAPEKNNVFIQGTYTGLVRFRKNGPNWSVKHLGETTMPIRFLVFEDQTTAWAAHAYKGLYKIKFDHKFDTIVSIKNYEDKGIWSNYNIRVLKIKNDICFKTNSGWQKYEPLLDSIVPFKLLNESLGKDAYVVSEPDVNKLVLKNDNDIITFKSFVNNDHTFSLSNDVFDNRLIVGFENVSKISDSTYALNLNDGFMLIDSRVHKEKTVFKPSIDRIEISNNPLNFSSNADIINLKFGEEIDIHMSSPKSVNHFFEYALLNLDAKKWYKLENHKLTLSNLKDGEYSIGLRTVNSFGKVSPTTKLDINILPPWYKNKIGYALYTFIACIVFFIMYALHKRKIDKEQKLLQNAFEREQEELIREKTIENEKNIIELRNESLKNEIKLKSKQLANTAMALVKKNETLLEIKNELTQNKNNFDNFYSYKKLLKKVDNSIAHKDEWEIFEYNFNQVHDEFFKSLIQKYPELTPKDLKICAYIKMNLSTKEIAPLMNISPRGVETHRYRLKKKLKLENDISLTTYLLNFK
ncbi:LuxR C-terminal-related transcriptional regulator [Psychroserpens sp. SPM9]|uniref:helix-turn-helix and ligand-binding sensor domain-containing protein n=1 Tax=Psychroserpens sp. SPM9 TaxID=2975598 RepID=UPI0021A9677A|nr:LuxR C-terminal-related transcriptional regulator [Psychroserpens sp. SPM9]MDG5491320.1 LuxR C-terminal-related transcriptional regulator [Psychroserpens sp. SPM9]